MSKKEYRDKALNEYRMESLIQREIHLIYDFKGTRPRWQRKKGLLLKRIFRTKDARKTLEHKMNRDDGILDSQLNMG